MKPAASAQTSQPSRCGQSARLRLRHKSSAAIASGSSQPRPGSIGICCNIQAPATNISPSAGMAFSGNDRGE